MNRTDMPASIAQAIGWLNEHSRSDAKWMLGGSCSLLLQGVNLDQTPRDIDIYADTEDAIELRECWKAAAVDDAVWDQTAMYHSLLSHYDCHHCSIELVGQFVVSTEWCCYATRIASVLWHYQVNGFIDGMQVPLLPLAHELAFNLLRAREDRVLAIAAVMNEHPEQHIAAMKAVLAQCEPSSAMRTKVIKVVPSFGPLLKQDTAGDRNEGVER